MEPQLPDIPGDLWNTLIRNDGRLYWRLRSLNRAWRALIDKLLPRRDARNEVLQHKLYLDNAVYTVWPSGRRHGDVICHIPDESVGPYTEIATYCNRYLLRRRLVYANHVEIRVPVNRAPNDDAPHEWRIVSEKTFFFNAEGDPDGVNYRNKPSRIEFSFDGDRWAIIISLPNRKACLIETELSNQQYKLQLYSFEDDHVFGIGWQTRTSQIYAARPLMTAWLDMNTEQIQAELDRLAWPLLYFDQ